MVRTLGVAALAAAIVALPATASAAGTGMAAMQYYVGNWNCIAGAPGETATNSTATYTLDGGVLRGWIALPAEGKMPAFAFQSSLSWDAKAGRYIQTTLDNGGMWDVAAAAALTGNIEAWTDLANSENKIGRQTVTRTDDNHFAFASYAEADTNRISFKGSCTRSGS